MSEIAAVKGFTVKDVDTLLREMAVHNYYYEKNKNGLPWNSNTFLKVLAHSTGSNMDENTGELILGDRSVMNDEPCVKASQQKEFDFDTSSKADDLGKDLII